MSEEDHVLTEFLNQRLPTVGLDAETYAPYLLPLLTEDDKDDEEWQAVMELLQASSESHSDDDQAFADLRRDIVQAWQAHTDKVAQLQQAESAQRAKELEQTLAQERQAVAAALAEAEERKKAEATKPAAAAVDDPSKRALLSRFAYDQDEDEDNNNNNKKGNDEAAAPLTNQQIAEMAQREAQQALRGKAVQTKKEEQQKTAQAKLDKARLKEERRKKATKGERKR
mmetsp:Transcript_4557/g.9539  ORF Transcript_4557/g.9539 Transcript_4557/m.9539 type:complete len:227 (-) Transcript_4557:164-844(-)